MRSSRHARTLLAATGAAALLAAGLTTGAGPAPSSAAQACPARTVAVPAGGDYRSTASGVMFTAAGATLTQKAGVVDYLVKLSGTGDCWTGGTLAGSNPTSLSWSQRKACCDSGLMTVSGSTSWAGLRADNSATDTFRLLGTGQTYLIDAVHITRDHDDCFSTAHDPLTVTDSLAYCYTLVSWRHTGNAGVPFPVTFTGDLFALSPEPVGGQNRCPAQLTTVGGVQYGNAQFWKVDSFKGSKSLINVTDTIFYATQGDDNACTLFWPAGTYTGDTFVWAGKGPAPVRLPAGVSLTTDTAVWTAAVNSWLAAHPGL